MITSGSLAALQEFLASWIAKDRNKNGHYFTSRVPKMAVYGAFISAPLGHLMISILQRVFKGRTSLRAKIMQIIVSNLIVSAPELQMCLCPSNTLRADRTYSKRGIPYLHGNHRRRAHFPPDPRHRSRRLHASHEGIMDHLSNRPRLRTSIPPA
jgi:hypothetical protein